MREGNRMKRLKATLDGPSRMSHQLGYHALQGFIFAMVMGPFAVPTTQWAMLLLPHLDDADYDEFCDLYYEIESSVINGRPALPADCLLAADPLRNFDPDAPISQWSQGFFNAQKLFASNWAQFLVECANVDTTTVKAFGRALVHLNFFASREIAEMTVGESTPHTIAEMAAEACASFETDMAVCAMFMRPWRERAAGVGPERRPARTPGTSGSNAHLKAFLVRPSNPPGVFSYHALQGFMFAVACAPRPTEPHEWLALVLGERPPVFGPGEVEPVLDEMRDLYEEIDACVARGAAALPPDCPVAPDPMANLDPAAPLSQWSRGVFAAHNWLAVDWMKVLKVLIKEDPDMAKQVGRATMHLLFFASPTVANHLWQQWEQDTLEGLAAQALREFDVGIVCYAEIGRGFRARRQRVWQPDARGASSTATRSPEPYRGVGRNQPCPCGSGRKYKKCCGAVH